MKLNSNPIRLTKRVTGLTFDAVIRPGDAALAANGLILSFSLHSPTDPFGRHFILDQRRTKAEVRTRMILSALAAVSLTVAGQKVVQKQTGQPLKWQYGPLLGKANSNFVQWIDEHTPSITAEDYGYFDPTGRLVISGALYAA